MQEARRSLISGLCTIDPIAGLIHWLARDDGRAGDSQCETLGQELWVCRWSLSWLLASGAVPTGAPL